MNSSQPTRVRGGCVALVLVGLSVWAGCSSGESTIIPSGLDDSDASADAGDRADTGQPNEAKDSGAPAPDSGPCGRGTALCGEACVDPKVDPTNCGECGHACGAGEVCSNGQCGLTCVGGSAKCDGKCVDTKVDGANCGECGHACGADEVCSNGQCGLSCVGGSAKCDGKCVDTKVDPTNCGECGHACGADEVCSNGQCGLTCVGGSTKCDDACVDTQVDHANCGTCGHACGADEVCSNGQCGLTCVGGSTKCDDACTNLQTDPNNCGACGNPCPGVANGTAACIAGQCTGQCTAGYSDCDGTLKNGCETAGSCGNCREFALDGFTCPTGATKYCNAAPISSSDAVMAKAACEACYGAPCYDETADCAGHGYGPREPGQFQCGDGYFGYESGCSGDPGRVWRICGSYTTYGRWAP